LSNGFALAHEVTSYEIAQRALQKYQDPSLSKSLWSWKGESGLQKGLLHSLTSFSVLRFISLTSAYQPFIFQHFIQTAGLLASEAVTQSLFQSISSQEPWVERILKAESLNLHFTLSSHLIHQLLPHSKRFELSLDRISAHQIIKPLREQTPLFMKEGAHVELESVLDTDTREILRNHYYDQYQQRELGLYGPFIVDRVLENVILDHPDYYSRLLDFLVDHPEAGTQKQNEMVMAIEEALSMQAHRSATGSIENALFHTLLHDLLSFPNLPHRNKALSHLFSEMNRGLTRNSIEALILHYARSDLYRIPQNPIYSYEFYQKHAAQADEKWKEYSPEDRLQLFNYLFLNTNGYPIQSQLWIQVIATAHSSYSATTIQKVLAHARHSPYEKIILDRFLNIVAANDIPEKLREIHLYPNTDTWGHLRSLLAEGITPEEIAKGISGTAHTAHFRDLRVARKIVQSYLMMEPYLKDRQKQSENEDRLYAAILKLIREQTPLNQTTFFNLLETNPSPITEKIKEDIQQRRYLISIYDKNNFDALAQQWGENAEYLTALFLAGGDEITPDRIILREVEPLKSHEIHDIKKMNQKILEIVNRLKSLVHEREHWRHTSGNFEDQEPDSSKINLAHISKRDRLVSETLAFLEHNTWHVMNLDNQDIDLARRQGITLATYYRNRNDRSHYQSVLMRIAHQLRNY
ncbi:MAG: hypothetical protein JNK65_06680, partial [Deltaproteobacteria bacterium]|nr:hypothetical protein [Deltaproteobacteria bacterium]